jgi:hypothetical protein
MLDAGWSQRKSRLIGDTRGWPKIPTLKGIFMNAITVKSKKNPVSRNQYPESANTGNGVRFNGLYRIHKFCNYRVKMYI